MPIVVVNGFRASAESHIADVLQPQTRYDATLMSGDAIDLLSV